MASILPGRGERAVIQFAALLGAEIARIRARYFGENAAGFPCPRLSFGALDAGLAVCATASFRIANHASRVLVVVIIR